MQIFTKLQVFVTRTNFIITLDGLKYTLFLNTSSSIDLRRTLCVILPRYLQQTKRQWIKLHLWEMTLSLFKSQPTTMVGVNIMSLLRLKNSMIYTAYTVYRFKTLHIVMHLDANKNLNFYWKIFSASWDSSNYIKWKFVTEQCTSFLILFLSYRIAAPPFFVVFIDTASDRRCCYRHSFWLHAQTSWAFPSLWISW